MTFLDIHTFINNSMSAYCTPHLNSFESLLIQEMLHKVAKNINNEFVCDFAVRLHCNCCLGGGLGKASYSEGCCAKSKL